MVVLSSDINTAMIINSIQWHRDSVYVVDATCNNFQMHMGLCASNQLNNESYEGNYITGTKTLVYSGTVNISRDLEWKEIVLQKPFIYDGTDNLIIEISWTKRTADSYYCQSWYAGNKRALYSRKPYAPTYYTRIPHMIFTGTTSTSLERSTFGEIKVLIGT